MEKSEGILGTSYIIKEEWITQNQVWRQYPYVILFLNMFSLNQKIYRTIVPGLGNYQKSQKKSFDTVLIPVGTCFETFRLHHF